MVLRKQQRYRRAFHREIDRRVDMETAVKTVLSAWRGESFTHTLEDALLDLERVVVQGAK